MKLITAARQKKRLARRIVRSAVFGKLILAILMFAMTINCTVIFGTSKIQVAPKKTMGNSKTFTEIREVITKEILNFEPEEWRILGGPPAAGRLKDWSLGAVNLEVEFCRRRLKQLASVKVSTPAEKLDKEVLVTHLKYLEYYYGQYHGELGNLQISVYPYDIIQYELQRFESNKTPGTETARNHFSAVEGILRALPAHLKQQNANLLAGLKLRKPDKQILQALIYRIGSPDDPQSIRGGLKTLGESLELPKMQSLLSSAQREAIRSLIIPADEAYNSHAKFLNSEIMPNVSDSWSLGNEEYKRRFALVYGEGISLDKLVKEAETELNRVNKEMVALANELRPNLSFGDVLAKLRERHFNSENELLDAYRQIQKRIDDEITNQLGLPIGAASYQSAPPGVPVSPATNWAAPLLSPGPGIVLVDTTASGLARNYAVDLPWVAAHEGNPGHASQSLLFQNAFNQGDVPLCRFLNVPDEVGYVRGNWYAMANIEGWAFYTERLLLKSNLLTREERLASLSGQALRAARVVVDIRMHTAGWSRERVTKYLKDKVGMSEQDATAQAYRYSRIPLQAVSYYFGARQFEELEKKYKNRFGDEFYQRLLSLGPVPPRFIDEYFDSSKPSNK